MEAHRVRTRARDDSYHHQGHHAGNDDMQARTLDRPSRIQRLQKGKHSLAS